MKKLMVMLAAATMAVAANATTFSWGISGGTGALDTEKFASGTAYLFYTTGSSLSLPDTTGWDKKTSFTVADVTSSNATLFDGFTDNNGDPVPGTGAVTAGAFLSGSSDLRSVSGTGTRRFYMAVISDDGKNVAITTSTKTSRIMASTTAGAVTWMPSQFATYSAAVPEPTSGLLMLVGLGALALRRRKA